MPVLCHPEPRDKDSRGVFRGVVAGRSRTYNRARQSNLTELRHSTCRCSHPLFVVLFPPDPPPFPSLSALPHHLHPRQAFYPHHPIHLHHPLTPQFSPTSLLPLPPPPPPPSSSPERVMTRDGRPSDPSGKWQKYGGTRPVSDFFFALGRKGIPSSVFFLGERNCGLGGCCGHRFVLTGSSLESSSCCHCALFPASIVLSQQYNNVNT